MLSPTIETVKSQLEENMLVPVFYEVLSDTKTPIHIYNSLCDNSENSFILESVDNNEKWGRYSFIGINPEKEIIIEKNQAKIICSDKTEVFDIDNPVVFLSDYLKKYKSPKLKNRPKLTGGLIGYFSYDTVRYIEKKLTNVPFDDIKLPECHLFLYSEIIAFDHLSNKVIIIINIKKDSPFSLEQKYESALNRAQEIAVKIKKPHEIKSNTKIYDDFIVKSNVSKEEFMNNVKKAKEYIVNGDIFQIVLSQRFEIENPPNSFDVYRMLRATNPSPYLYYFKNKDYHIAGASPEMLVNVTDGIVTTKPIAGTIGRGQDEEEDKKFEQMLNLDPKERAEHTMLVDLGRNDVGRVSEFGTVEVTSFMQTEKYSKVMHLVSDVQGKLKEDKTAIDALMSVLPAGTLSGAPKVRAMEIIDEMENRKRCLYGGTVGYLAFDGNIDTCIAIRTVLIKNDKAYIQAGAGIVADSIPEKEYVETQNKALAIINAIKEASKL